MNKVEVVPHDTRWANVFEAEAEHLVRAMGESVVAIYHIGSTAIPGIYAKPIIDMLVEVRDVKGLDKRDPLIRAIGYEIMGEFGIPGRRYFRKDNEKGVRIYHVHAFVAGSPQVQRHLAFRDYMIAHPDEAERYSVLKQTLAEKYREYADAYMDGKEDFIHEIDRQAKLWRKSILKTNREWCNIYN